jgi:hypothetical protein
MLTTLLKNLSLDDLIRELINRERQLQLSKMNKSGNNLIQYNKNQLQKVQTAINNKTHMEPAGFFVA